MAHFHIRLYKKKDTKNLTFTHLVSLSHQHSMVFCEKIEKSSIISNTILSETNKQIITSICFVKKHRPTPAKK